MKLYIAREWDTGKIETFLDYHSFKQFAKENRYAYEYFSIPITEYSDYELFLK